MFWSPPTQITALQGTGTKTRDTGEVQVPQQEPAIPYSSVGRGRGRQFRQVATVHTGPSTAPRSLLRPTVCGSSPHTTIPNRVLWECEASDTCVCPVGYKLYRGTHPRGRGSLVSIVSYPLGHQ